MKSIKSLPIPEELNAGANNNSKYLYKLMTLLAKVFAQIKLMA